MYAGYISPNPSKDKLRDGPDAILRRDIRLKKDHSFFPLGLLVSTARYQTISTELFNLERVVKNFWGVLKLSLIEILKVRVGWYGGPDPEKG